MLKLHCLKIDLAYVLLNKSGGNMWIGTIIIIKEDNLNDSNKLYLMLREGRGKQKIPNWLEPRSQPYL